MARYQLTFRRQAWRASESVPTSLRALLRTPSCTNLHRQADHQPSPTKKLAEPNTDERVF
jgi:hypothetical protein